MSGSNYAYAKSGVEVTNQPRGLIMIAGVSKNEMDGRVFIVGAVDLFSGTKTAGMVLNRE
jgi:hypothetical protein